MIEEWEICRGVHQWYATKGDHLLTADSIAHMYIYIIDFEREERKHDQDQ